MINLIMPCHAQSNELSGPPLPDTLYLAGSSSEYDAYKQAGFPVAMYLPQDPDTDIALHGSFTPTYILQGEESLQDTEYLERIYLRLIGRPWIIAQSDRLIIRESEVSDLDFFYNIYDECRAQGFVKPLSLDRSEEQDKLAAYIRNLYGIYGYGLWSIVEKCSGRVIGRAGFFPSETSDETELGYIIDPNFRRAGYAFEACTAILRCASDLGITKAVAVIDKDNAASRQLAEKLVSLFPDTLSILLK